MIDKETIMAAKAVDMNIIFHEFKWDKDRYGKIRCPNPDHKDSIPSCAFSASRNTCRCFVCRESFDTIDLYRRLSEKVDGRTVPFYKAVEEILELDAVESGSNGSAGIGITDSSNINGCQPDGSKSSQPNIQAGNGSCNSSPYEMIIHNSSPLMGYELNYLHGRGIMLYDSYIYCGKVHTRQSIENAMQTATDQNEINRLNEIKNNGVFYKGIAPILKANRIQIKHNFWQGVNSIIYLVDYDSDDEDDLICAQFFMDTERHMAVQKSIDGNHVKRALGEADFNFITQGFEHSINKKDVYICEGMEDALSYTMNGIRSISLNSIANLKSLIHYLAEDYVPHYNERFVICFDHDEAGEKATRELKDFFESYNQNPSHRYKYSYAVCDYQQEFHDMNDYWKSRVFG